MSDQKQNLIDRFSEVTGKLVSWLTLIMVVVTFVIVVMRYAFDAGLIWLQESVIWLHAAVFMLGAAYTLKHDEHVRVDVFYRSSSAKRKAWIDFIGVLLFLLPVSGFLLIKSWDFAAVS
ncbi:MAG: TRAP transporter small permease subunit, partial [Woeseiaceae bacterium]